MKIRPAKPEDALEVAHVHVRAWQIGYRDLLPRKYLDHLEPEERAQHYDFASQDMQRPITLVAMGERNILGFATTMPSRDEDAADHGELCGLYVDPPAWRKGIGGALLAAAEHQLLEQGFQHAILWLLAGNERAERFYNARGWIPDKATRTQTVWGIAIEEQRYRRKLPSTSPTAVAFSRHAWRKR